MAEADINYHTLHLSPRFSIVLQPFRRLQQLTAAQKKAIDLIWDREKKKRGRFLHEGQILHAIGYDSKKLVGCFIPYKYFFAQVCDPSLQEDLQIIPVSVSGITESKEHILLGKRAPWVAQHPCKFELVPSGGISPPSAQNGKILLKQQLLQELQEEAHIPKNFVKSATFFALVSDLQKGAVELIANVVLKGDIVYSTSDEYTLFMTLPKKEIAPFVSALAAEFVPFSLHLLKLKKFL